MNNIDDFYRRLLDDPAITSRLFRPMPSIVKNPFVIDCGDASLVCSYNKVESPRSTVVYFHGNGELVSDYEESLPRWFAGFDCSCLLVEYRGYGMSTGEASLTNLIDDVSYIIPALAVPAEHTILYGRSFGSLPAIHAAFLFPKIRGLILESGISDLTTRIKAHWLLDNNFVSDVQIGAAVKHFFNHQQKLASFQGITAITHCFLDTLVSVSNAYDLHSWAIEPKSLDIFFRGDHNSVFRENLGEYARIISHIINDSV